MDEKKQMKILIVDDEKVIRDFLGRLLRLQGVEVKTADDGFNAIEMIQKERDFDLIFMDVRMPKMDGLETYMKLKAIKPDIKCVMMTGYAVDNLLEQAKKEGAVSSIRKPFDITQIEVLLSNYVLKKDSKEAMKILVIDDEVIILDFFKRLLDPKVYDVIGVKTGEDAVAMIKQRHFDLVFLDLILGDINGMDLYAKIHAAKPDLEIVVITGHPDKAEEMSSLDHVQGCLYKPFDISKIFSEIEKSKK